GDDPVLDVDLPGAGAGAVHAVGGANHLVMAPTVAVEHVARAAALPEHRPAVGGLVPSGEKLSDVQEGIAGGSVEACRFRGHGSYRNTRGDDLQVNHGKFYTMFWVLIGDATMSYFPIPESR